MQALDTKVVEDHETVASLNRDVENHAKRVGKLQESLDSIAGLPSLSPPVTTLRPRVEELMRIRVERELSRALDRRNSWPSSDDQLNYEVSNRDCEQIMN